MMGDEIARLEQALAEKDREIVKWSELIGSFTRSQHRYLVEMERLKQALAEKDREITHLQDVYTKQRHKRDDDYQQLLEKAVKFAQYIKDEFTYDDDPRFIEADEFLNSPEVQAWKEKQT